ncbi:MAG TPA: aminoglycoside phosphotransferase family protein [Acidimicrobiales bacterium]|nr:aminoglycoside phosphotransferase family protein [Acidimicrobiales bacterium]
MSHEAAVAAAVSRHIGPRDWRVSPVPGFAGNQVFLLCSGAFGVVVKIADPGGLAAEAHVADLVRTLGVPAPEVLAVDSDHELGAYMIMRQVEGSPVDGDDRVFREVGAQLRVVHETELDGFGWLGHLAPQRLAGRASSWTESITRGVGGLDPVVGAGLFPAEMRDAIGAAVGRHREVFDSVKRGRLVHGDIHPRHVFTDQGRLSGIIDWGDAGAGDPLFDLGRLLRADPRAAELALQGYGDLPYDPEDLERRMHLYAVVFIVAATVSEFAAGAPWPAWFDHQLAALHAHLKIL